MDERNELPPEPRRRYTWPWFVLGAGILFLLLAIVWMSYAVRHMRQQRENETGYPTNPPAMDVIKNG